MSRIVDIEAVKSPPLPVDVLRGEGIPENAPVSERVRELVSGAIDRYAALTDPRGIYEPISREDFERVYREADKNAARTPVEPVSRRAERMALFAITLGNALSEEITRLFSANEPAQGYMLDAIASERADLAARMLAEAFRNELVGSGEVEDSVTVLPYSPGYCGWHITGQRPLFEYLEPGRIGIRLNESCLMHPLKSVSGVLIAGPGEIHAFDNDFDFCADCATKECRIRIASVTCKEVSHGAAEADRPRPGEGRA
jgi:hypothetical protein